MKRAVELRRQLVDLLDRNGSVRTPAVRNAFATVPREVFVPQIAKDSGLPTVYSDEALVTRKLDGLPTSSSSQPTIMALMLEALDLHAGDRVLEIGLGTGYNAALMRTIIGPTGSLTSIDIDPDVVAAAEQALRIAHARVETVCGDGTGGHPASAPYDRIIATASTDHIPRAWWEQLHPDGIVVAPLRIGALQLVVVLARTPGGFVSTQLIPGGFMPMRPSADASTSSGVTITVETNLGDGHTSSLSISGPGLDRLTPDARAALTGRLMATPRIRPVDAGPARSVLWHAVIATGLDRSIAVFGGPVFGGRFGVVDDTGAAALLQLGRHGGDNTLDGIELYGAADTLAGGLIDAMAGWRAAGEPDFDRLALAIDYDPAAPVPAWAVATTEEYGQRRAAGWRP